jgi:hypothetical protein
MDGRGTLPDEACDEDTARPDFVAALSSQVEDALMIRLDNPHGAD